MRKITFCRREGAKANKRPSSQCRNRGEKKEENDDRRSSTPVPGNTFCTPILTEGSRKKNMRWEEKTTGIKATHSKRSRGGRRQKKETPFLAQPQLKDHAPSSSGLQPKRVGGQEGRKRTRISSGGRKACIKNCRTRKSEKPTTSTPPKKRLGNAKGLDEGASRRSMRRRKTKEGSFFTRELVRWSANNSGE